jgi:transposase
MKKIIHFIGIDVSKETLDIALIRNNDKSNIYSSKVTNNKTGFKKMKQWLKVENVSLQEAVFCIEHTGMYSKPIVNLFCRCKEIYGWKCL